jgi:hypothetical protein
MFKHVYVTELVQVVTRTLRFREPVGEGYLRPDITSSDLLIRNEHKAG